MASVHPLDRLMGEEWPVFATEAQVRVFESTPYATRIAAQSTYEALRLGAACNPDADAIVFLPQAEPDEAPVRISHRQFFARVTQAANLFTGLGIGARSGGQCTQRYVCSGSSGTGFPPAATCRRPRTRSCQAWCVTVLIQARNFCVGS